MPAPPQRDRRPPWPSARSAASETELAFRPRARARDGWALGVEPACRHVTPKARTEAIGPKSGEPWSYHGHPTSKPGDSERRAGSGGRIRTTDQGLMSPLLY